MRGIILAAGAATRMRPLADTQPKCLLKVGGIPILQRSIENLAIAGIEQIGLVIGYRADMIRAFVKEKFPFLRIRFIVNPKYESTNNAYSLLLARDYVLNKPDEETPSPGLLLLDADIVFTPELLPFLLTNDSPDKIAVRVEGHHDEEEVRVKVLDDGRIVRIGKTIPFTETFGESIGIEVFSSTTAQRLFEILEQRVRTGDGRTEFYEASFQALIDEGAGLQAIDVSNFPCVEIDTPEDLRAAEVLIASPNFSAPR
jgi:choline kinase